MMIRITTGRRFQCPAGAWSGIKRERSLKAPRRRSLTGRSILAIIGMETGRGSGQEDRDLPASNNAQLRGTDGDA